MKSVGKINIRKTSSGFFRGEFKDANGEQCSIQESSAADYPRLWLGQNGGTHHMGHCLARMHLDQETAKALIPLLKRFVRSGNLRI